MWLYLLIFLIPLALALRAPRARRYARGLAAFYVALWVFTGLRFEVGADWRGYTYIYQRAEETDWSQLFEDRELGFLLINKLVAELDWGLPGVNAICAAIFLMGLYRFAITTANPWLATAAVTPYLIYIVSMSGIRQATALGLALLALSRWNETGLVWKILLIAVAASVHNSAVFFFVFILWDGSRYPLIRATVGTAVLFAAAYYLKDTGASDTYSNRYFEQNVESGGAFFHVALSAIPAALFLLFRGKIRAHGWSNSLVMRASLVSVALVPLVLLSSTGASRLSLYLSFVQMWAFPAFVAAHGKRWRFATAVCLVYFLAIFVVYFTLGTHVYAYIPYRNILLEGW